MKRSAGYLKSVLWTMSALVLALTLLLDEIQFSAELLSLLLVVSVVLLFFPVLIGIGLALLYRHTWQHWPIWIMTLLITLIAGTLSQNPVTIGPFALQGVAILIFIGGLTALLTAVVRLLFQRDIALALFAGLSLSLMWGLVLWWRLGGDLILALLNSLQNPTAASIPTFWLSVVMMSGMCLFPLLVLSFVAHSLRLLRNELRAAPLPSMSHETASTTEELV